jgi:DNA primase
VLNVSKEIEEIAAAYLKNIRRSGAENIMAICPFHRKPDGSEERRPSFAMNIYTGVYFCHTCQAAGTLRRFLMDVGMPREFIHLRYKDLLEEARKNLPPPPDPTRSGVFDIEPISEGFLGLFDGYDLQDLLSHGFRQDTILHFEVGYDKWHSRYTYPIRDLKGDLVGISGRSLDNSWPKYKIYDKEFETWGLPPRLNWDKRKVLYNGNDVYPLFINVYPTDAPIVVVEGFKACMWVWQAGIRNVVALLGSYLSWEQEWILNRIGSNICLFLDNNFAGIKGTMYAGNKLMNRGARVVGYPDRLKNDEDAQPDSCTAEEVLEQVRLAPLYEEWLRCAVC